MTVTSVQHLAIDGSAVDVAADTALHHTATATGWAIVPSMGRTHPFTIYPAGHAAALQEGVRATDGAVRLGEVAEYSVKGGRLQVAQVSMPTATGGERTLTVAAWEGERGCLTTSLIGAGSERLVEVFDTLRFGERRGGLAIDSPVTVRPREPEVVTEIPALGVVAIRPAVASVLEKVPRAAGHRTRYGELFRVRAGSDAMTLVTSSAVASIQPVGDGDAADRVGVAETLRIDWTPAR